MAIHPPEKTILTVSQLNRNVKQLIERQFPLIWVSGEISNLARPASGHWYFSLKDDAAQVRTAMFKGANMRLRWHPEAGQQVLIRARVSLYEGRGEYQLIAEHMEPAGVGQLQQAYEELKRKLAAEGLFDDDRKQRLPTAPEHIAVITSPTGAAIHDILSVFARRYPVAKITIIPAAVQGELAAPEIITGLSKAHELDGVEVIIIGRGGGSIEDLWAFNNEALVRAIAASTIPIVSAVGHEVDFTLCDFAADIRAATPTASAEITTPELSEWLQSLDAIEQAFHKYIQQHLATHHQQLIFRQRQLKHPKQQLAYQQQRLTEYRERLGSSMARLLTHKQQQYVTAQQRLTHQQPSTQILRSNDILKSYQQRFEYRIQQLLQQRQEQLAQSAHLLNAVNPLAVLSRGYSVTRDENGNILTDANKVTPGTRITTRLHHGEISSEVIK